MTSVSGAYADTAYQGQIDRGVFTDPAMRPGLKEFYESRYAPVRERIADMKEAEANGEAPQTVSLPDGTTATAFTAAQYEAIVPTFDKWLELQENFSIFDMLDQSESCIDHARKALETYESAFSPEHPSGVRTAFSEGDQLLAYIDKDGGLVTTQEGGSALQKIAERAGDLGLSGEEKIAYIRQHVTAELSRRHPDLETTDYTDETMPTRGEFAETWYPDRDVYASYRNTVEELRQNLAQHEEWHDRQMQTLNEMRAFLIESQSVDEVPQSDSAASES